MFDFRFEVVEVWGKIEYYMLKSKKVFKYRDWINKNLWVYYVI